MGERVSRSPVCFLGWAGVVQGPHAPSPSLALGYFPESGKGRFAMKHRFGFTTTRGSKVLRLVENEKNVSSGRGLRSWAKRGKTVAADRRRRQPPEIRREARESHPPSKLRASRTTEHGKGERERRKGAARTPDLRPLRGLRSGASVMGEARKNGSCGP